MAGGVTVGFRRSRALVGEQTVSWSGEACALHSYHSSEPFAASRVCDERSGTNRRTALDPAPASQALPVSLDFADASIDILSLEGPPIFRCELSAESSEQRLQTQRHSQPIKLTPSHTRHTLIFHFCRQGKRGRPCK